MFNHVEIKYMAALRTNQGIGGNLMKCCLRHWERMFFQEFFTYSDLKAIRFYAAYDFWGGMMPNVRPDKIATLTT